MDWSWLAPATFGAVAGSLAGAATALGVSWVDRRWREQDIKAAERRKRAGDRLGNVRRYGAALEEFVSWGLSTYELMCSDPQDVRTESWHEYYESRLVEKWEELAEARSVPLPFFEVRDDPEALYPLIELELRASQLQIRMLRFLMGDSTEDAPDATAGMAEARDLLSTLVRRLDLLAEGANHEVKTGEAGEDEHREN